MHSPFKLHLSRRCMHLLVVSLWRKSYHAAWASLHRHAWRTTKTNWSKWQSKSVGGERSHHSTQQWPQYLRYAAAWPSRLHGCAIAISEAMLRSRGFSDASLLASSNGSVSFTFNIKNSYFCKLLVTHAFIFRKCNFPWKPSFKYTLP